MLASIVLALAAFTAPKPAFGHGDIHLQIEVTTSQIKSAPTAELYVKRGELYRVDEDYEAALADFDLAEKLDPNFDGIYFSRGRTLFEAGHFKPALEALDHLIQKQPGHILGLMVRGRLNARLRDYSAAVEDFESVVALLETPRPECYLDRAEAQAALGENEAALKGHDEGIRQLGNLLSLQSAAIDLELKLNRYDAALARVDRVIADMRRKEIWQERRAKILEEAGRHEEALRSYGEALASLDLLSPTHRTTKPMLELETRLLHVLGKDHPQNQAKN